MSDYTYRGRSWATSSVLAFARAALVFDAEASGTSASDIYAAYRKWAGPGNQMSGALFGRLLGGYLVKHRAADRIVYDGIVIRPEWADA